MPAPALSHLEALLAVAFDRPVRIAQADRLGPWAVQRCRLETGEALPDTVIVKWLRQDPGGFRVDPRQIGTEAAALTFLAEIGFAAAPRLVAADLAAGVLVMDDLAPRGPLDELIVRQGADACAGALGEYAELAGRLQAASVGRAALYEAIRGHCGPLDPAAGEMGLCRNWPRTRAILADRGLPMPDGPAGELAAAVGALLEPGPFLAFSNGDPELNNVLVGPAGARLIDFEAAAFRHALASAVWIHMPGPAWLSVGGSAEAAKLEAVYRRALAEAVPQANDERRFGLAMAGACAAWAFERLKRFDKLDARPVGEASRPQMVSMVEAAAAVLRRHSALPRLGGWLERAGAFLRRRWPDADLELSALPAYTPCDPALRGGAPALPG